MEPVFSFLLGTKYSHDFLPHRPRIGQYRPDYERESHAERPTHVKYFAKSGKLLTVLWHITGPASREAAFPAGRVRHEIGPQSAEAVTAMTTRGGGGVRMISAATKEYVTVAENRNLET